MISQSYYKLKGVDLVKTQSDTFKIRQKKTGLIFDVAIDPVSAKRKYEETDIPLPKVETLEANKELEVR